MQGRLCRRVGSAPLPAPQAQAADTLGLSQGGTQGCKWTHFRSSGSLLVRFNYADSETAMDYCITILAIARAMQFFGRSDCAKQSLRKEDPRERRRRGLSAPGAQWGIGDT